MAEENKNKKRLNKIIAGMNTDVNPIDQLPGSYRFAYNAITNREIGAISNEEGTTILSQITTTFEIIGSIVVNDFPSNTRFIIFLCADQFFATSQTVSEIGKIDFDGNYTVLMNDGASVEKFNFTTRFPIEGEYKINATGKVSIYWTDDYNVPRYLNLSNIPAGPQYTIQSFDLFPKITKYPQITLDKIRSNGGVLRSGAYQLSVAYMTEDGAITSYLDVSNPVYINDEHEGTANQPSNSWGGSPLLDTDYNGCDGGTQTSKAIIWDISNLDTSYKYIQPCIIRTVDQGKDAVTIDRYTIPASGANAKIFYSGVEQAVEELLVATQIPKESYTKAKTVAQVDDVLYWGNLERDKIDIGYQKFANSIRIFRKELNPGFDVSNTQDISGLGNVTVNYTKAFGVDGYDSSNFRGYKRGEVYAFYITFVLKDGSETVAYHIPGRAPITSTNWRHGTVGAMYVDDEYINLGTKDTGGTSHPFVSQITHLGNNQPFWYFHHNHQTHNTTAAGGGMGYWQNQSENYPSVGNDINPLDGTYAGNFETWTVDANGDAVALPVGQWLHGKNVRHHHFPLCDAHSSLSYAVQPIHQASSAGDHIHAMNPLGFRVNDIPLPDFVVDKCVAYKIYYIRKGLEDRVCIDSSMVQAGRINGQEHFNTYGDAWICFPWQVLDAENSAGGTDIIDTPFFTANPLDLIQSGESINSIDYIASEPTGLMCAWDNSGVTNTNRAICIWAKDSMGDDFDPGTEFHVSFDWTASVRATNTGMGNNVTGGTNSVHLRAISGKTRAPSGAIIDSATGFNRPVDNEGATETIAFQLHDSLPFYNNNFTGFYYNPYITAQNPLYDWPTTNQFGPNAGNMGRRVFNFMSLKTDVHFGFDKQRDFIYTGYSEPINLSSAGPGGGYLDRSSAGAPFPFRGTGVVTLGGDVCIGYYTIDKHRKSDRFADATWYHHIVGGGALGSHDSAFLLLIGDTTTGDFFNDYTLHVSITESRHNPNLKHANNDTELFYPAVLPNHPGILNHDNPSKSPGLYNLDYNTLNDNRLIRAFDPDDVLQTFTDHPTRLIRSVKYNQSGLEDNFRVYLPEDFRDLPRHRGELWKVKSYNNIIIPHMERSLYITKGKETLQMTDASEAFLGTGDLFEKEPAEVLLTDRGHAGTGSQWASITSEFGYFFVDKEAGKVFLMGEQLEEISMYGMRKFFLNNLETGSQAAALNPTLKPPKNFDNPIRNIGLHATYDAKLKRFILTKKDIRQILAFPMTDPSATPPIYVDTIYDAEERWWYHDGAQITNDGTETGNYWEEYNEWTISYDPQTKTWVSFHAYWPHHYIMDLTNFFAFIGPDLEGGYFGYKIYEHNTGSVGTYYGVGDNPWIIDYIDNEGPDIVKSYMSFDFTIDVEHKGTGAKLVGTNPFDRISVYNSYQESGYVNTNISNSRRNERTWSFNGFRDLADITADYPSTTAPMTHTDGDYVTFGTSIPGTQTQKYFPDINDNFIDNTKQWFNRRKFVDKWAGIRLFASNSNNNLVSLYTLNAHKKISYR